MVALKASWSNCSLHPEDASCPEALPPSDLFRFSLTMLEITLGTKGGCVSRNRGGNLLYLSHHCKEDLTWSSAYGKGQP